MQWLIIIFADAARKLSVERTALPGSAEPVLMPVYSLLLAAVFIVGAPYWLLRMATSGRYRAGLSQRLGRVPSTLRAAVAGRKVIWLHAVSVGEVLAATSLVAQLEAALEEGWIIVVSTTTATGQALATKHFGAPGGRRVFYYPLDFAFAVRSWLRALNPRLLVLMESELWPRMLAECARAGVPVAVVNARVSDRSFSRAAKVRTLWKRLLARPALLLAQSDEDARRLTALGAPPQSVRVSGNLKYDAAAPRSGSVVNTLREAAAGRTVLVAGSTHGATGDNRLGEEQVVVDAWQQSLRERGTLLILAPRHPQRFAEVAALIAAYPHARASSLASGPTRPEIILLDTIGDLAAVYAIADLAYVGGSLVPRGGHNPLEPARFAVPVVIGASYENFRDIVGRMRAQDAIRIVGNPADLAATFSELLSHPDAATALGHRGQAVFEQQQGATARTVEALTQLLAASSEALP